MASSDWHDVTLGDIVEIKHGWPFRSEYFNEELTGRPIVVNIGNFQYTGGFRFKSTTTKEYRAGYPKEFELSPGDILLVMTCQTPGGEILGIPARIPDDGRLYLHNQRMGKVILRRPDLVSEDFLYYVFLWKDFNRELAASATGTKILHTAPQRIRAFRFHMPPLDEQHAIARILGALEDEMELNRQMNRTLEAVAQAIFKSWFVDFDPVVARAAGRRPFGLDAETAALFPDRFVDSELGPVPEGWRVSSIGQEVQVVGGSTPRTNESGFWDGGTIPWLTPRDLSRLADPIVLETGRCITEDGLAQISSGLLPPGTVLLSSRAPIGYLAIAEVPVAVNQGFIAMVCRGALTTHYVFHWTREIMDEILNRAGGTTFAEINKANFRPIAVLVPIEPVLAAFESVVLPIYDRLVTNIRESRSLSELRDTLIPRLLSGKIRLKHAEKIVDGAV